MEKRAVSAAVVDARGRILLVRRATPPFAGRLSLPGGKVLPGEGDVAAVRREVLEETGIHASGFVPIGERRVARDGFAYVIAVFAARSEEPSATPNAGDDADFADWFDREALEGADLEDEQRAFVASAFRVFA